MTEEIIRTAEKSLDLVLPFYEGQGVPLSYRPKIVYINEVHPLFPEGVARAKAEVDFLQFADKILSVSMLQESWRKFYSLEFSEKALEELFTATLNYAGNGNVQIHPLEKRIAEDDSGIFLFKPYNEFSQDTKARDRILAHEVWHLIEQERGVINVAPMINEGTATYAERRFVGKKGKKSIEDYEDYFSMIYNGSAKLVQDYVDSEENPLKAVLETSIRLKIEDELLRRIKPKLIATLEKTLESQENMFAIGESMKQLPVFARIQGNVTAENLLRAYEEIGAQLFVEEAKRQDLTKFVEFMKKSGL
ncbi:MAG: hypothetical protein Q8N99_04300 [Nanoarchaeota archaeon]|nr:hypothetical protein [Nanoarchaeota archaeon]